VRPFYFSCQIWPFWGILISATNWCYFPSNKCQARRGPFYFSHQIWLFWGLLVGPILRQINVGLGGGTFPFVAKLELFCGLLIAVINRCNFPSNKCQAGRGPFYFLLFSPNLTFLRNPSWSNFPPNKCQARWGNFPFSRQVWPFLWNPNRRDQSVQFFVKQMSSQAGAFLLFSPNLTFEECYLTFEEC